MSNELKADLKDLFINEKGNLTKYGIMLCLVALISLSITIFKMMVTRR